MKKALTFFLICFLLMSAVPLFSGEDNSTEENPYPEGSPEGDWYGDLPPLYSSGDMTFSISLGLTFPVLFIQNNAAMKSNISAVGGTGNLCFNYFLNAHFFLGGEIGLQFNSTLAKNTLFLIPIGLRTGYQFLIWKIEIPVNLAAGICPHRYLNLEYLGMFVKGGASAYYRFNPDWSFGMDLSWTWFPEWTREPAKNADGNFISVIFSARYHF